MPSVTGSQNLTMTPIAPATESPAGQFNVNAATGPGGGISGATVTTLQIQPGQVFTVSLNATLPSGAAATVVRLYYYWRDSAGTTIGSTIVGSDVTLTSVAQTLSLTTGAAPANASSIRLGLQAGNAAASGRAVAVTNVQLASSGSFEDILDVRLRRSYKNVDLDLLNSASPIVNSGTPALRAGQFTFLCNTLDDALAVDSVYCQPVPAYLKDETDVATNLVENPTYVTNDLTNGWHLRAQWGGTGGVTAQSVQYDDGTYIRKTWTTASTTSQSIGWQLYRDSADYQVSVNPGDTYTVRCKVRGTHGTSSTRRWQCQFMAADKTTSITTLYGPNEGALTSDWQTMVWTFTVPAGAKYARPVLYYDNGSTPTPVGATSDIKEVIVVKGTELPPYFDGDTRPAGYSSRWNGVPNSSTSTLARINALNGFKHYAVESGEMSSEEALPGKACRWLFQVEVREVV